MSNKMIKIIFIMLILISICLVFILSKKNNNYAMYNYCCVKLDGTNYKWTTSTENGKCDNGYFYHPNMSTSNECIAPPKVSPSPSPILEKMSYCCIKLDGTDYKWTTSTENGKCDDGYFYYPNMSTSNECIAPPKVSPSPSPIQSLQPAYDITLNVPIGFSVQQQQYSSSTLKYKIVKKNGNSNHYYALIWVKDANAQINCANNNFNPVQPQAHFNKEIEAMRYQGKGMIGTNGGYAINGRDNIPVLVTKGVYKDNEKYSTTTSDGRSTLYGTLTVSRSNQLISKTSSDTNEMRSWLQSNGARNTWSITFHTQGNWHTGGSGDVRTTLCQVDSNNFVLSTGRSDALDTYHKELHDTFGCTSVVNLDGGGSTGMYYKTNSMNSVGKIYQYKRPSETTVRSIVDIIYFVEQ